MKCTDCGGNYRDAFGAVTCNDKCIGEYAVADVSYWECGQCGGKMYGAETARRIDAKRASILAELIGAHPIQEFVTAQEAIRILGISRQAFHKNRRIKRGLIFQTQLGRDVFYLKTSVERFKSKGDGRFLIKPAKAIHAVPTYANPTVDTFSLITPQSNHFIHPQIYGSQKGTLKTHFTDYSKRFSSTAFSR